MKAKVLTLVFDTDDEDWCIAVYENPDHADQDYPWNYKETRPLRTETRTQTPEKVMNEGLLYSGS